LALPAFKSDYVVPAFLVAVVVNLALLIGLRQLHMDYSDPVTELVTLLGSFVIGLVASGLVWATNGLYFKVVHGPWMYNEDDPPASYVRKVLLRPNAPKTYDWVSGTAAGVSWQGIRLSQPTGALVLGATLQVSRTDEAALPLATLRDTV